MKQGIPQQNFGTIGGVKLKIGNFTVSAVIFLLGIGFLVFVVFDVTKPTRRDTRRKASHRVIRSSLAIKPSSETQSWPGSEAVDAAHFERRPLLAKFRKPATKETAFTYVARKPLHVVEQELYWKLRLSIPSYSVLPQVALSQIVTPVPHIKQAWNPIAQKVVDFLVLRRDFMPLCVIELDGRHHLEQRQRAKDEKRDAALNAAGIPVIRWTMRTIPSSEEILAMVKQLDMSPPN